MNTRILTKEIMKSKLEEIQVLQKNSTAKYKMVENANYVCIDVYKAEPELVEKLNEFTSHFESEYLVKIGKRKHNKEIYGLYCDFENDYRRHWLKMTEKGDEKLKKLFSPYVIGETEVAFFSYDQRYLPDIDGVIIISKIGDTYVTYEFVLSWYKYENTNIMYGYSLSRDIHSYIVDSDKESPDDFNEENCRVWGEFKWEMNGLINNNELDYSVI